MMGRKYRELAENDPITVLYHRSVDTLDKRVERGTLDKDLAAKAKQIARDCRDIAIVDADYANEEYYSGCPHHGRVQRKAYPRDIKFNYFS